LFRFCHGLKLFRADAFGTALPLGKRFERVQMRCVSARAKLVSELRCVNCCAAACRRDAADDFIGFNQRDDIGCFSAHREFLLFVVSVSRTCDGGD
jgi:hypothetical protein